MSTPLPSPTTLAEVASLRASHRKLLDRAVRICGASPFGKSVPQDAVEDAPFGLTIDGDTARLACTRADTEDGGTYVGVETCEFPAFLLTLSEAKFQVEWPKVVEAAEALRAAREAEAQELRALHALEKRRSAFLALKQEFEPDSQP